MEPVTHVLTGACLARSGFNRRAAYTTAAMAIAAEFPDIDTLWGLHGPIASFQHHRGITHTLLGLPFEAAFILLLFFLWHRWRIGRKQTDLAFHERRSASPGSSSGEAPPRWGVLYGFVCLALLSHILLDYTNNYGVRPFFPFNPHWFAASIVFIFDPLLFFFLVCGLALPGLFGLISREVGARRERYRGRGWARTALAAVLLLWVGRTVEHAHALQLANRQTLRAPGLAVGEAADPNAAQGTAPADPAPAEERALLGVQGSLASPDPLSVFRWYTVSDFGPAYRLGVADTRRGTLQAGEILAKPASSAAERAAENSPLGRVYLDWSPMPFVVLSGPQEGLGDLPRAAMAVRFSDPRFAGDFPLLHRSGDPPLTGTVLLDAANHVVAEGMDGRFTEP